MQPFYVPDGLTQVEIRSHTARVDKSRSIVVHTLNQFVTVPCTVEQSEWHHDATARSLLWPQENAKQDTFDATSCLTQDTEQKNKDFIFVELQAWRLRFTS